jgi:hypothetical protein
MRVPSGDHFGDPAQISGCAFETLRRPVPSAPIT